MAKCSSCGKDTELFVSGSPLCLECVAGPTRDHILEILRDELKKASQIAAEASQKFDHTVTLPAGLPHPDGTQQVHRTGLELSHARGELRESLHRLNKFLVYGEVPDDLKRY